LSLSKLFMRMRGRTNRPASLPNPKNGGARRDRTDDILLAKQALSQLSYGPISNPVQTLKQARPHQTRRARAGGLRGNLEAMVGPGRLELPTSRLSGVRSNHLSYGPVPTIQTRQPAPKDTSKPGPDARR